MKGLELKLGEKFNIYVISDTHGNYPLFYEAISKLSLKDDDYLFVLGDSINRHPYSIECLDLLAELKKRSRTYFVIGNHELHLYDLMTKFEMMSEEEVDAYTKGTSLSKLFSYWGNTIYDFENFEEARKAYPDVLESMKAELSLIESMNSYIETEDFIFVHSGLKNGKALKEHTVHELTSTYSFFETKHSLDKIVVVGHWPTKAIPMDNMVSSDVRFFLEDKMIFIDGGNSLDMDRQSFTDLYGQINCLNIKKDNGEITYSEQAFEVFNNYCCVEDHPKYSDLDLILNYGDFKISVNDYDDDFYHCYALNSKQRGLLLKDFYKSYNFYTTYAGKFLTVKKGEIVNVKKQFEKFMMVKKDHEFGLVLIDKFKKM